MNRRRNQRSIPHAIKKYHSTGTYGLELLVKRMYKGISIKMKGLQSTCTYTLDSHVHKNQERMSKRDNLKLIKFMFNMPAQALMIIIESSPQYTL